MVFTIVMKLNEKSYHASLTEHYQLYNSRISAELLTRLTESCPWGTLTIISLSVQTILTAAAVWITTIWAQDNSIHFILAAGASTSCNSEVIPLQFQG